MCGSPLVYELEDVREFSLDPLTDSKRPGVQTAIARWMLSSDTPDEPQKPPPVPLGQRLVQHRHALLFVIVMSLSSAIRWGL